MRYVIVGLVLAAGYGLLWWAVFASPAGEVDRMPADRRRRDGWQDDDR